MFESFPLPSALVLGGFGSPSVGGRSGGGVCVGLRRRQVPPVTPALQVVRVVPGVLPCRICLGCVRKTVVTRKRDLLTRKGRRPRTPLTPHVIGLFELLRLFPRGRPRVTVTPFPSRLL